MILPSFFKMNDNKPIDNLTCMYMYQFFSNIHGVVVMPLENPIPYLDAQKMSTITIFNIYNYIFHQNNVSNKI